MREIELIDKRKRREKHFLQEDGTIIAKIYSEDIHYLENGKYEEIDNTLIEEKEYYTNKKNSYKVHFSKKTQKNIMKMENSNHYLDIRLKQEKPVSLIKGIRKSNFVDNLKYQDILNNIDLEYKILPNKVKESIVIKEKNNIPATIDFIVDTDLNLILNNNKSISAIKDSNTYFVIDAPYMVDANGKINKNIHYELVSDVNGYKLTLILDTAWLNRVDIAYPVTIDPTITNSGNDGSVYDTYIYSGDTGTDRNSQDILKVGVERINGQDIINRTLIKFDLPNIGTGSQIMNATLVLVGYPYPILKQTGLVSVHEITSEWNEQSANWSNMSNKYNPKSETAFYSVRSVGTKWDEIIPKYNYANITSLVKKWYFNTPNNGILLKSVNEEYNTDIISSFFSKDNTVDGDDPKPYVIITYINQNGLENYMNYYSQIFRQGVTNVNIFNGNLISDFNIGETKIGKFPIKLNIVYNTNDVILENNFGYGLGLKLNMHQIIEPIEIEDIQYLKYLDEDGTIHYFSTDNNSNIFVDEEGLNMCITQTDSHYILKDKNNNEMKFIKKGQIGYLTELMDNNGNHVVIEYNNKNLISRITDANNQEVCVTYESDKTMITDYNQTIVLNYQNNKLLSIVKDTGTTYFFYNNNNLLEKVLDEDGKFFTYDYYENVPYKVKKIVEYGLENTLGKSLNFEYNFDSTTITDNKNRVSTYNFNKSGNVASVSSLKNQNDLKNAYAFREVFNNKNNSINKLGVVGTPIKYVKNYLKNTSFEKNNIYFIPTSNEIQLSITSNFFKSGNKCLKIESNIENSSIIQSLSIPKGNYYTFSTYLKNTNRVRLALSYINENNEEIEELSDVVYQNDNFERFDVTINYPQTAISDLKIKLYFLDIGTSYIDDIQLEEGEVSNNYNIIENSDFSDGFVDWEVEAVGFDTLEPEIYEPSEYFEIGDFVDNGKALKIKMNYNVCTSLDTTINMSGNAGDLYNISFWYKNEGVISNDSLSFNNVMINFIDVEESEFGHCALPSTPLNINGEQWQYFSYNFVAESDYKGLILSFFQQLNANNLYITNISLFKDIRENYYDYDESGNVSVYSKLDQEKLVYDYNKNNYLVNLVTPTGSNYYTEYDETDINPIKIITPSGVTGEIKYDNYNNVHTTKIKYIPVLNELISGLYKIRLKGSEKYINLNGSSVVLSEKDFNSIWELVKQDESFKIKNPVINNKFLTTLDFDIIFSKFYEENSNFEFVQKKNNIYLIKNIANKKYLKNENNCLVLADYIDDDNSFEFCIEKFYDSKFIEYNANYTEDGNFLNGITNSDLTNLTYQYNELTGLINYYINEKNQITNNMYNQKQQLIGIKNENKEVTYNYNLNSLLSKITSNDIEYNIEYNNFLNIDKIKLGANNVLVENIYEEQNGNLISIKYGNNNQIYFEYDEFDRISKIIKQDNIFNYKYNNNGLLTKIISNNSITKYNYDLARRLHKYIQDDFYIKYTYDKNDNVVNKEFSLGECNNTTDYIFNKNDYIEKMNFDNQTIAYNYNELGMITDETIGDEYCIKYEYINLGKRTFQFPSKVTINNNVFKYKYDKLLNITHIYLNDKLLKKYYYDSYNQLIKEDNLDLNTTIKYYYNSSGNLLFKKEYELFTNNLLRQDIYEYNDESWKDKLTKYNDTIISYDSLGNPLSIGDNINMSWINGRQLSMYSDSINTTNYIYNEKGIRICKKFNNVETRYYLEGNKIIFEKTGDNTLYYIYNAVGNLIGFKYNDVLYYYIKNLHQDIIGILDENFNKVASYEYDTFGNIISIKDSNNIDITNNSSHIANINPFRYRSYYYDKESNLYYLNSRYYNPLWGRFLNADEIINGNADALGNNLFLYVSNNFINYRDEDGKGLFGFFAVLTVGIVSGVVTKLCEDLFTSAMKKDLQFSKPTEYFSAAVSGAVSATVSLVTPNPVVVSGISSAIESSLNRYFEVYNSREPYISKEFLIHTSIDASLNIGFSKIVADIPGINKGRNNYGAIYNSGLTKLKNNTAQNMSLKVLNKGIINNLGNSISSISGNAMKRYIQDEVHDNNYCVVNLFE